MWADNGDECSLQYAGTGALKVLFHNAFHHSTLIYFRPITLALENEHSMVSSTMESMHLRVISRTILPMATNW